MKHLRYAAYYRVSTKQQGKSGLGLEAQQEAVRRHLAGNPDAMVTEFIEVESGKRKDRPELARALQLCRQTGAVLIIAKLDRLARNVAFVSSVMESGIEFVACDNPQANRLTLHILAAVAEDEARRISERTKAALEAAKVRGVKLGGDRGYRPSGRPAAALSALQQGAQEFAHSLLPIILRLQDAGVSSLNALAAELNNEGIRTARGGTWHASSVKNVLTRLDAHMQVRNVHRRQDQPNRLSA
ncbi:recombinase family protein [Roseibium aggregatum]|nr:recombinase family protein [Roseibium aggregatum]WJS03181.1 recombinase family protein [Roseibium aggregatum]